MLKNKTHKRGRKPTHGTGDLQRKDPSVSRSDVTWILVIANEKAHIYNKDRNGLKLLSSEKFHSPLPEKINLDDFIFDLAEWLCGAFEHRYFKKIAIIAPQETLKILKPLLSQTLHDSICAVLPRDIRAISEEEIEDHLAEVVWF